MNSLARFVPRHDLLTFSFSDLELGSRKEQRGRHDRMEESNLVQRQSTLGDDINHSHASKQGKRMFLTISGSNAAKMVHHYPSSTHDNLDLTSNPIRPTGNCDNSITIIEVRGGDEIKLFYEDFNVTSNPSKDSESKSCHVPIIHFRIVENINGGNVGSPLNDESSANNCQLIHDIVRRDKTDTNVAEFVDSTLEKGRVKELKLLDRQRCSAVGNQSENWVIVGVNAFQNDSADNGRSEAGSKYNRDDGSRRNSIDMSFVGNNSKKCDDDSESSIESEEEESAPLTLPNCFYASYSHHSESPHDVDNADQRDKISEVDSTVRSGK